MKIDPWVLIATVAAVLVYIALPVALAVIYLSRINAALGRKKEAKLSETESEKSSEA